MDIASSKSCGASEAPADGSLPGGSDRHNSERIWPTAGFRREINRAHDGQSGISAEVLPRRHLARERRFLSGLRTLCIGDRSEERRVGKECRAGWWWDRE